MTDPKHVVVVSCLVRNREGDILLIRSPKRGWELPQGRVEEGETLPGALRREVMEETGIEIEPGPLAAVFSKLTPPPALIFGFLATSMGGAPRPSAESPEVLWLRPEEALARVDHPVNRDRLITLLEFSGPILYRAYRPKPFTVAEEACLNEEAGCRW